MRKTIGLIALMAVLMVNISLAAWNMQLGVGISETHVDTIIFGTADDATDDFDPTLDVGLPPPPPSGALAAFSISNPITPNLSKDIRAEADTLVIWKLIILNNGDCSSPYPYLHWNPNQFPDMGQFLVAVTMPGSDADWGAAVNMRSADSVDFLSYQFVYIRYISTIEPVITDFTPPYVENSSISDGDTISEISITFDIKDDDAGVDSTTIQLSLPKWGIVANYNNMYMEPITGGYRVTYPPPGTPGQSLPAGLEATFIISACDDSGNCMSDTSTIYTAPEPTYTLNGTVTLEGESDHSGIIVNIDTSSVTTDATGEYEVTGLLESDYTITMSHDGFFTVETDMHIESDTFLNVTLNAYPETLSISGTVYLEDDPADLSESIVEMSYDSEILVDTTDVSGAYALAAPESAEVTLIVEHIGYLPDTTTFMVLNDTIDVDFTLFLEPTVPDTSLLNGIVSLEGDTADNLSGSIVEASYDGEVLYDTTDIMGAYSFNVPESSNVTLIASHEEHYPDTATFLAVGDTITTDFSLALHTPDTVYVLDSIEVVITGVVELGEADTTIPDSLAGSIVELYCDSTYLCDTTDLGGAYSFSFLIIHIFLDDSNGIYPHDVYLIANHAQFYPDTATLGVISDTTATINFELAWTSIKEKLEGVHSSVTGLSNSPNPFHSTTNISFSLEKNTDIELTIHDIMGKKLETLYNGKLSNGLHTFSWTPEDNKSGIYLYKLENGKDIFTQRMIYIQ